MSKAEGYLCQLNPDEQLVFIEQALAKVRGILQHNQYRKPVPDDDLNYTAAATNPIFVLKDLAEGAARTELETRKINGGERSANLTALLATTQRRETLARFT